MSNEAVIAGSLVDVRNVGLHKAVKLTIHVPEEHAMKIMDAFGWPTGVKPVSVVVARLVDEIPGPSECKRITASQEVRSEPPRQEQQPLPTSAGAEKTKRKFDEMSPAQQAGMLCNDEAFRLFLREKHGPVLDVALHDLGFVAGHILASKAICDLVGVDRKTEITPANAEWTSLVLAYRLWQREPSVVPA